MQPIVLKNFFVKLINNSVSGKTMENLRKRMTVKLVTNAKDYVRYMSKPSLFHKRYLVKTLLLFMK